ncbi:ABC transporter ATP-binding protein [Paenibacillus arenilitoris]|uniref:ABC transporter ATP-binding protein n=1 Tax=Paenibacillus arenilitoris TaxID=2772299 RepID=A0A927H517_9BACL|nr:ABC transporter ATP-binding protein [Paenibacillus arenilitoris]MBD2867962.1 ABC transporter ATP-binding protein [Paenibacillus arenilitoris]
MDCDNQVVINVKDVTKDFPLIATNRESLKSTLLNMPKKLFNKKMNFIPKHSGLKNISFSLKKGETLGIVGRNGSGKSTLAKLLAGVTYPTTGKIEIDGRVAGLLELGAGFHPELSAKQNIFLNGMLLGLTRKEIELKVDEILSFANLEDRVNQPIRTFSSGMQMRLGYSVATHVEADLLIIDEALAVGDEEFQIKCKAHLNKLRDIGTTMVVITHDMSFIEKHCSTALLIDHGSLILNGTPNEVISKYKNLIE